MIMVTIFRDGQDNPIGFEMSGHAGYAENGNDIVCAGVSVLALNTINSIETFTEDEFTFDQNEEDGFMKIYLTGEVSSESKLLIQSFVLGINSMIEAGNEDYIKIDYKEV